MARFNDWADEFERVGLSIKLIGNGKLARAEAFVATHSPAFPVYTDPSCRTYAAAGLNHNHWLSLRTVGHAARAYRGGHRMDGVQGDPNQQGGVLAVSPSGRVLFFHADKVSGDSVDPGYVWMRCRNAMTAPQRRR